jgi:hypothetical protein
MDGKLFNFTDLKAGGDPDPEGDTAFDPLELPPLQPVINIAVEQD